ncbi:MAG: glycosyltransferase family 2 protein [Acidobacteria bacterium]|nr:glycosyltransferase family 2 protein [Acidobacteriota bacterium]
MLSSFDPSGESCAPQVHAVIVNWNGRQHLLECLSSLKGIRYPESQFCVTIVDNGSTDGSQKAVRTHFPHVILMENPSNFGYVAAVNQGVAKALEQGAEYIWIFNNDVVVYPDTLANLVKWIRSDSRIAVAGPIICSYEDETRIDHSGYKINLWIGRLRKLRYGTDVFANGAETADVDSILGCSNLIRADAWKEIGPLDPAYDLYFEETDFNTRARSHGWRIVLVKEARVRHRRSATMNLFIRRRAWLLLRNLYIFQYRNAQRRQLLLFTPYYFLIHVPWFMIRGLYYILSTAHRQTERQ